MEKRRKRIEQWREERDKKQGEKPQLVVLPPSKNWSLEDDDDEEDPAPNSQGADDDEIDPLDAYMQVSGICGRINHFHSFYT